MLLLLKIQQGYVENEDTGNVKELFDNIMKEAEYGDNEGAGTVLGYCTSMTAINC